MKLKKIIIKNYKQLKNIEIDLTYPKGHPKAGKPLDKICILGKSGTGKTTLLRLIKWFVSRDRNISENFQLPIDPETEAAMDFEMSGLHYRLVSKDTNLIFGDPVDDAQWHEDFNRYLKQISPLLINYPADLMPLTANPGYPIAAGNEREQESPTQPGIPGPEQIIDFSFEDIKKTWDFILADIKDHRARELLIKDKIVAAKSAGGSMQEIQKQDREYQKWLSQNPSPLQTLAIRFLDPILHKLGLKVKTDLSYQSIIDLTFIELQALNGETVHRDLWSTGTRQQVMTMLPLYQLKPRNAVILIDEPERSLYPDIQLSIADDYAKNAPDCQFFFATHSPFITASFEPWEIIELKFDNKNTYAYRALNYSGKKREDALDKLADINIRMGKLKREETFDSPEGRKLAKEYLKLNEMLDWRTG